MEHFGSWCLSWTPAPESDMAIVVSPQRDVTPKDSTLVFVCKWGSSHFYFCWAEAGTLEL